MTITPVWLEGFDDDIAVSEVGGWTLGGTGFGSVTTPTGRDGVGTCVRLESWDYDHSGNQRRLWREVTIGSPTHIVGSVAMKTDDLYIWKSNDGNHQYGNLYLSNGTDELGLFLEADGSLSARPGDYATAAAATSPVGLVTADEWVSVRFALRCGAGGSGRLIVHVDDAEVIDVAVTFETAEQITVMVAGCHDQDRKPVVSHDDLWIGTGTADTDVPDDYSIYTRFPTGTTQAQGTGSDADQVDNHLLVDEQAVPDTDYVDLAAGEEDIYSFDALPYGTAEVVAVQARVSAERTAAGVVTLTPSLVVDPDTDTLTGVEPGFGSVGYHEEIATTAPGGGAWSLADVNALELGVAAS